MKRITYNNKYAGYLMITLLFLGLSLYFMMTPAEQLRAQKDKWTAITHDKTNFPLEGKHRTVPCADCHLNGVMQGTPTECEACHWGRKQDDRYRLQLGNHCADCHTPFDWKKIKPNAWDHGQVTGFRLEGIHGTLDCFQCHKGNSFATQQGDCYSCHQENYRETSQPNHVQNSFPTDCRLCHKSMTSWEGAIYDHSSFPLRAAHQATGCTDCHKNGQYKSTPRDCAGCHMDNYYATTTPNHKNSGYSTDCQSCHGSGAVTWTGAILDHSKFPLNGKHQTAICTDCHKNGQYTGTSQLCFSCHQAEYNNTKTPNHQQAGYATDCERCHGSAAVTWLGAATDHSKFPLKGKHQTANCTDCHKNGQYAGTSQLCFSCHQPEYNNTRTPNHQQAGYATECERCHGSNATSWTGATVDHSKFPLNGKHKTAICTDCHKNGQYSGLTQVCFNCHTAEYNGTTNPNHKLANFPTDCVPCHGTAALTWQGATFNHNQYWPLQGAHTTLDCTRCHDKGYDLPRDCYGCHRSNYEKTQDPKHVAAGFPTSCDSCHFATHVSWNQAVFNHRFPIKSGKHSGLTCTDCHVTANYREFACINCHEHNKADMDKEHREERGYSYNSPACYSCHPTGKAD